MPVSAGRHFTTMHAQYNLYFRIDTIIIIQSYRLVPEAGFAFIYFQQLDAGDICFFTLFDASGQQCYGGCKHAQHFIIKIFPAQNGIPRRFHIAFAAYRSAFDLPFLYERGFDNDFS